MRKFWFIFAIALAMLPWSKASAAPADSAAVDAEFQHMFGALGRVNDKAVAALAKSDTAIAEVRALAQQPAQIVVKKVPYTGPGAYTLQALAQAAADFAKQRAYYAAVAEVKAADGDTTDDDALAAADAWKNYLKAKRTKAGRKEAADEFVSTLVEALTNANIANREVNDLKDKVGKLESEMVTAKSRLAIVELAISDAALSLAVYGGECGLKGKGDKTRLAQEALRIRNLVPKAPGESRQLTRDP